MTREQQIKRTAYNYPIKCCHLHWFEGFIVGAEWADRTMLQEVFEWLDKNFFTGEIEGYYSDVPEHIVQGKFDDKEQMLQSFKERFNIE